MDSVRPPTASQRAARLQFLENDHLLGGHFLHRVGNAADAVAGLAAAGEGHPVGAEGGVIVDHDGGRIEALAGAPHEPRPLRPALHVLLLGAAEPLFIRSQMVGEHDTDVQIGKDPLWEPAERLQTDYLGPFLAELDA